MTLKTGELKDTARSGEELYQEILEREKSSSPEKLKLDKQQKQKELLKKRFQNIQNENTAGQGKAEHLYQQIKHKDC